MMIMAGDPMMTMIYDSMMIIIDNFMIITEGLP